MKKTSGTMLNYYFICKRKLWYHCHQIQMERENEDVQIGKIIDETTYAREKKQILINDTISTIILINIRYDFSCGLGFPMIDRILFAI